MQRLSVGITGSPGSGKTTVSNIFRELGAVIIDVDEAGRWVLDHCFVVRDKIEQTFGKNILQPDGRVNRGALRDIVFIDKQKLFQLNNIVHPLMINRVRQLIIQYNCQPDVQYIIVDAALIFELYLNTDLDYVLTVTAPLETRLQRLSRRHKISLAMAQKITDRQITQEEKEQRADFVLDNALDLDVLRGKIQQFHDLFIREAQQK